MKKKSNKLNLIICGFAFIIMIVYMFFIDDSSKILGAIQKMNPFFLLIAALFMLVYWLLEAIALHIVTKTIHDKIKFKQTFVVSTIGQYFNCITPFASGGQPIQAVYLVKYGVPLGSGMTALLSKFISYQFVLTIYSAVLLILRFTYFTSELGALMALVIIGFIVNAVVILLLFMLAFFRTPSTKIAHFIVRLLHKIRIIKDLDEKLEFIDHEMDMYYENFIFIKSKPAVILKMCLATFVQLTFYFSITFVIYLGLGLGGGLAPADAVSNFLTIISCQAFVLMISSFVPLPGAMGAAEGSYLAFFTGIFGDTVTFSTFVWRFLTFYFPIIVGLIITLAVGNKMENKS